MKNEGETRTQPNTVLHREYDWVHKELSWLGGGQLYI